MPLIHSCMHSLALYPLYSLQAQEGKNGREGETPPLWHSHNQIIF